MNDIDRLVQELYAADSPSPPAFDTLWAPVERRIGRPAGSRRVRRPRLQRRFVLVFGVALAGAIVFALLPARRHTVGGSIPESASAAQVLRTLADQGSPLPDVPRGSFLYTSGTRIVLSSGPNMDGKNYSVFIRQHRELWVGRDGSQRIRVSEDRVPVGYPSPRDRRLAQRDKRPFGVVEDQITHSPLAFRRDFGMTPAALRRLPSNPSALAHALQAVARARYREDLRNDRFHTAFDDPFRPATSIYMAPIRPATRAAMLRALASFPRVRRLPDESLAGKRVVVVALRFKAFGSERFDHVLLLDPTTGELVGARYVSVPNGAATSRWTWRHAVVPTLRSRPADG